MPVAWLGPVGFYSVKTVHLCRNHLSSGSKLLLSPLILWLIELPAFWNSRRISRSNERPCQEYDCPSEATQQAQGSPTIRRTARHHQWTSQYDGRSDRFYSDLAQKLDRYVSIRPRHILYYMQCPVKHILVVAQKDKANELQKKLDAFAQNFDWHLLIEIRAEQGLILVSDIQCPNHLIRGISHCGERHTDRHCKCSRWVVCDSWSALVTCHLYTRNCPRYPSRYWQSSRCVICVSWLVILLTHNFALANVKVATEQKELDGLLRALGENKLSLRRPCMEGTHTTILQEIENEIQSVDGHNVI